MSKIYEQDNLKIYNADCMEIMSQYEDNYFDLAVVDPPYGIGGGSNVKIKGSRSWDDQRPPKEYFDELDRVSKKYIIWGGNYFSDLIPNASRHTIIWDKQNGDSFMSDGEIAFTNIDKQTTKFYRLFWMSNMMKAEEKPLIHPTQKAKELYRWIYANYAEEGQKILDTHLGSGSNAIAAHYAKMNFVGCELDEDYYKAAIDRIRKETRQLELF